jgi:hypothetical protein
MANPLKVPTPQDRPLVNKRNSRNQLTDEERQKILMQLDDTTPHKKTVTSAQKAKESARINQSQVNTPVHKPPIMEEDDLNKQEISKQLEEIEKQHIGLKDQQSMSEFTTMSKIKPIKSKEYQNQQNIIDEQTNESVTQNQRQNPPKNIDPHHYEKLMQSNDLTDERPKMKFLDQLLA